MKTWDPSPPPLQPESEPEGLITPTVVDPHLPETTRMGPLPRTIGVASGPSAPTRPQEASPPVVDRETRAVTDLIPQDRTRADLGSHFLALSKSFSQLVEAFHLLLGILAIIAIVALVSLFLYIKNM